MNTILYNKNTDEPIGKTRKGHYLVDGKRPELEDHVVELTVVETQPSFDETTHYIESSHYEADVENLEWRRTWVIKEKDAAFLENELNQKREELIEKARQWRQQKEEAGFEFGGMTIPSDRISQAMLNGALAATSLDPEFSTPWSVTPSVFVTLTAPQIQAMASILKDHVRQSFADQADMVAQIVAAESIEDLNMLDETLFTSTD